MRKFLLTALIALLAPVLASAQTNLSITKTALTDMKNTFTDARIVVPVEAVNGLKEKTTTGYTVAGWVKMDALPNYSYGSGASWVPSNITYLFSLGPRINHNINGCWLIQVANNGLVTFKGWSFAQDTDYTVTVGEWVHYAVVVDNTNLTIKLYINGVQKASHTFTEALQYYNETEKPALIFGGYGFGGEFDEVQVFNSVLSATEISTAQTNPMDVTGVSAYYSFNNGIVDGTTSQFANEVSGGVSANAFVEMVDISSYTNKTNIIHENGWYTSDALPTSETAATTEESDRGKEPEPEEGPFKVSTPGGTQYYYTLTERRTSARVITSNGAEAGLTVESSTSEASKWRIELRDDGTTYNIINKADGTYMSQTTLDNIAATNNPVFTTSNNEPSAGWVIQESNSADYYIIASGTSYQFNTEESANSTHYIINYGSNGGNYTKNDAGCDFRFDLVEQVAPATYSVSIETPVNGTLSVTNADDTPVDDLENVLSGTELKAVATAATGYVLSNIAITANGVTSLIGSGDTFTVLGNTTVSATFVDKNDLVRVIINPPINAGTSTFEVYNGDVKLSSGDRVPRGTTLTFVVHPTTELELDCYMINGATYKVDTYTINYDSQITVAFKEATPEPEVHDYCTSGNRNCSNNDQRNQRRLIDFSIGEDGETNSITVNVNQAADNGNPSYFDKTTSILTVSPGATIKFKSINWNTGGWMHGFVYVDYDNNGEFNQNLNTGGHNASGDVAGGEVVSYSSHNVGTVESEVWRNSKGENPNPTGNPANPGMTPEAIPAFTIPADLQPGSYRARFKIDWNDLNPCGSEVESAAGAIVDFTIVVQEPEPVRNTFNVTVSQGSGAWFACSELEGSLPAGECFTQESGIPETGKFYILTNSLQQLQSITIDNGGNSETITIDRSKKEYWNDYNTGEAGAITSIYRDGKYYYFDNIEGDVNVELVFDPNSSAIDGIATEKEADANAPVEYFNIQGVKVSSENLAPGFYIVRQGTKASKVYINR